MYKFLLCWRYLRTRYIALASIISVTLGVATMIVVNSVMAGFSHEMHSRLHSILSDIVFEAHTLEGFPDPQWHMQQIRNVAGDAIVGMTPTVTVPAMLSFQYGGNWVTRPVQLIGIDEKTQAEAGDFTQYVQHPENRQNFTFDLHDGGYGAGDPRPETNPRDDLLAAGWPHRRRRIKQQQTFENERQKLAPEKKSEGPSKSVRQAGHRRRQNRSRPKRPRPSIPSKRPNRRPKSSIRSRSSKPASCWAWPWAPTVIVAAPIVFWFCRATISS